MKLSLFDLFKVGIGPSSSHTVGPMVAAGRFVELAQKQGLLVQAGRIRVELFGSLAMTGLGHATDTAVLLGLAGERPDQVDPDQVPGIISCIRKQRRISLAGKVGVAFDEAYDLRFHMDQSLPQHPNGMRFTLLDGEGEPLFNREYFSVGGGFVLCQDEIQAAEQQVGCLKVPYPFSTGDELLQRCSESGLDIAGVMMANESALQSRDGVEDGLRRIWQVMESCIERGCRQRGPLPGGLGIHRRAAQMRQELIDRPEATLKDQLSVLDWVNLYAMAVNEENAAGGRVVTAPTNGAAGVIPAVLAYYHRFVPGADEAGIFRFLTSAGAIGMLYKTNASISAAEVGCQGEVGVACSMAAAGLTAVLGGTPEQVENAAEIGMEHNLGLTCDPVNGLVQVPCIERNTMGAIKAINAARLALRGDGRHRVSLDSVIETMHQTGRDMQEKYKETSLGGLAVNVVAC